MLLYQILAHTIYKINKFEISAPKWNKKLELPDGSSSVLDIQIYFMSMIKRHGIVTYNPLISIYLNQVEYRITSGKKDMILI